MHKSVRIGLIEVGSNAIRCLVADYEDDTQFEARHIETVGHGLSPLNPTVDAIDRINEDVERFLASASAFRCDHLLAYGTAACRVAAAHHPGRLTAVIKVLTPEEEARAAWIAGLLCGKREEGKSYTAIDLGNGSIEVAGAKWEASAIGDFKWYSAPFGTAMLLEAYKRGPTKHIEFCQRLLEPVARDLLAFGLATGQPQQLFLLGGVATSIGWRITKKTGMQSYRPAEVNGAQISLGDMDQYHKELASLNRSNPLAARMSVDTRKGSEDHVLKILATLPAITMLAAFLQPTGQFIVSGYGVRHGMAVLLRRNLFVPSDDVLK